MSVILKVCRTHPNFLNKSKSIRTILKQETANRLGYGHIRNSTTDSQSSILKVNTNVVKDVVLFKYENPRQFKLLNIFAIVQFGFWSYLAITVHLSLIHI